MSERPDDLIHLVVEQYKKIKSRIVLQALTSHPDGISLELESDCKEQENNNKTCSNVHQATVVQFTARINIGEESLCQHHQGEDEEEEAEEEKKSVEIGLRGFPRDRLKVLYISIEDLKCIFKAFQCYIRVCNSRLGSLGACFFKLECIIKKD